MGNNKVFFKKVAFGFQYGALTVERQMSVQGHVVIELSTPRTRLQVRVTPMGLIRIHDTKDGKLLEK